ncbi:MAG: hypothetical protein AAF467_27675 [Actinomycetota bacterium]
MIGSLFDLRPEPVDLGDVEIRPGAYLIVRDVGPVEFDGWRHAPPDAANRELVGTSHDDGDPKHFTSGDVLLVVSAGPTIMLRFPPPDWHGPVEPLQPTDWDAVPDQIERLRADLRASDNDPYTPEGQADG